MKDWMLRTSFGITLEGYNKLFELQGGRCAICGKHQSEVSTTFHVDHDHETGRIRALLCSGCNIGIGQFKEDVEIIKKVMEYLNTSGPHSSKLIEELTINYKPFSDEVREKISIRRKKFCATEEGAEQMRVMRDKKRNKRLKLIS